MSDPTSANVAIAKALGLDPTNIRKGGVHLWLNPELGPIVEVTMFLTDKDGKRYAVDDEVATTFKRFRLVPIDDEGA